jgi:hypothetical protein
MYRTFSEPYRAIGFRIDFDLYNGGELIVLRIRGRKPQTGYPGR